MKRISCILLTSSIWLLNGAFSLPPHNLAIAQTLNDRDLFYMYKGQRIPLNQRQDALAKLTEGIAVAFKRVGNTRGGTPQPLYLQLQQALQGGTPGVAIAWLVSSNQQLITKGWLSPMKMPHYIIHNLIKVQYLTP